MSLKSIADSTNQFKTLQDHFRQASMIGATRTTEELEDEFNALMQRMDDARSANPPIPDRYFENAKKKIQKGAYGFDGVKRS